ncbi:hypothetical protein FIU91_11355 [Roseivivax sp. THAF30]|jgi:hypothetical protein|nr:hypothetical protein FIU91_11355 [Roseivivax sp. THAF30]
MRMRLWAQRPKSAAQVKIMLGILAACFALYSVERWIGWPDALTAGRYAPPARVAD